MTDANFKNAGNPHDRRERRRKDHLSQENLCTGCIRFQNKMLSPSQIKMSIYAKEILAIYFAFMEYSHVLWESTKPVVVLTDNKSVTRFFQTKMIPPA